MSLLLSTHPCAPLRLTSLPTFLLTTSPSPAPLTSVRWPDSNAQAAAGSPLAHVLLFPSLPEGPEATTITCTLSDWSILFHYFCGNIQCTRHVCAVKNRRNPSRTHFRFSTFYRGIHGKVYPRAPAPRPPLAGGTRRRQERVRCWHGRGWARAGHVWWPGRAGRGAVSEPRGRSAGV